MKDVKTEALALHEKHRGKIEISVKVPLSTRDDLALAYTPGVAEPCLRIKDAPELSYRYTNRGNTIAVVSDGSAVLGLGNIGGLAGMPVMEGKCALFKAFAGIDALPIVLSTQDPEEIIAAVKAIAPSFGGINLEDISAPRCFYIEQRLKDELDIPVFHDDQHGTAIVTLAAVKNSLKVVEKRLEDAVVCVSGPGAAGTAIAKLLICAGVKDVIMNDFDGIIYRGKPGLDFAKKELSEITNLSGRRGMLKEAAEGTDVFIGVSKPEILNPGIIASMNRSPIVFAMANPVPEIMPDEALKAGAAVAGSGRSDFPNQVNNVLAFPGVFKGALAVRKKITEKMKLAAADALADLCGDRLCREYVIPDALDERVADAVANAVKLAAKEN